MKRSLWLILGLMTMAPAQAADTGSGHKYFAVTPYYVEADEERGDNISGRGLDLGFGAQLSGPLYGEIRAFGVFFEDRNASNQTFYDTGFATDLQLMLGERGKLAAFAVAGVGFAFNDVGDDAIDDGGFQANAGLGLLSRGLTSSKIRLRLDARAVYEEFLDGITDYRLGVGLEIPLDPVEEVVREVIVEKQVRAEIPAQAYPPRPQDADKDGILDNFDQCAGTLPNTRVDRAGCALPEQVVEIEGVNFHLDSAKLRAESLPKLDQAAAALQGQPSMRVIIAGHTDATGSAEYNKRLSWERARSVRSYLEYKGIASQRMKIVGYGEERPLASNESESGRQLNRRVEFEIVPVGAW